MFLYLFCTNDNDFVIIGFEADAINLLHTFVFSSLPPNEPLELTLQNITSVSLEEGVKRDRCTES